MAHVVTAPLIQVADSAGTVHRFRKGAVLAGAFDPKRVKQLVDEGYIAVEKPAPRAAEKADDKPGDKPDSK